MPLNEKKPADCFPLGEETLLSEKEAAKFFPWTRKTFANKRGKNEGPPYRKIGKNCYYQFGELKKYFNRNRINPEGI